MARESSRANALLVELLLVIFFFMISAAILVQLFANARHKSLQARAATNAIAEAQNVAENLYNEMKDNPESWIQENGFTKDAENKWSREYDGYTLYITKDYTDVKDGGETPVGQIRTFEITGHGDGKDLFTIPSTRYVPTPDEPEEVSGQ
jgi:type II secretory pathway pseudopilin PulG